jgi:hypothetical protein
MAKFFLLFSLAFFLSFSCVAQSYLGQTREEIYQLISEDFKDIEPTFFADSERPYLQLKNGYETLYYYLEDDICVEFVVIKPYSCNCLETDFNAYEENCIALAPFKWASKDYSKFYEMTMQDSTYSLSIVSNTSSRALSSRSE